MKHGWILLFMSSIAIGNCAAIPISNSGRDPYRDAQGYLIQPSGFAVAGERFRKTCFLQFSVNGISKDSPFILCVNHTMQPDDVWPSKQLPLEPRALGGFPFSPLREEPERSLGWVILNTNQIAVLANAIKKSREWSEIANKENIAVESKQLVAFTNEMVGMTFSRVKDSTDYTLCISLPTHGYDNFNKTCEITIDKRGADRLLGIIATLPQRRRRFVEFEEKEKREEMERIRIQEKEKARADELLR